MRSSEGAPLGCGPFCKTEAFSLAKMILPMPFPCLFAVSPFGPCHLGIHRGRRKAFPRRTFRFNRRPIPPSPPQKKRSRRGRVDVPQTPQSQLCTDWSLVNSPMNPNPRSQPRARAAAGRHPPATPPPPQTPQLGSDPAGPAPAEASPPPAQKAEACRKAGAGAPRALADTFQSTADPPPSSFSFSAFQLFSGLGKSFVSTMPTEQEAFLNGKHTYQCMAGPFPQKSKKGALRARGAPPPA